MIWIFLNAFATSAAAVGWFVLAYIALKPPRREPLQGMLFLGLAAACASFTWQIVDAITVGLLPIAELTPARAAVFMAPPILMLWQFARQQGKSHV